jgi:hypothetical protein
MNSAYKGFRRWIEKEWRRGMGPPVKDFERPGISGGDEHKNIDDLTADSFENWKNGIEDAFNGGGGRTFDGDGDSHPLKGATMINPGLKFLTHSAVGHD